MSRLDLFSSLTQPRQELILKKIIKDNEHLPQFEQKLRTMILFSVRKALNKSTDIFSYAPTEQQRMAIGYRIHFTDNNRYAAEPWAWLVSDVDKSIGIEISSLQKNCMYMGTMVPLELYNRYGTTAYNLLFGNLRTLEQYSMRKISL